MEALRQKVNEMILKGATTGSPCQTNRAPEEARGAPERSNVHAIPSAIQRIRPASPLRSRRFLALLPERNPFTCGTRWLRSANLS